MDEQWELLRARANRDGAGSLTPSEFWRLIDGRMIKAAEILDKKAKTNRFLMAENCLTKEGKDFFNSQAATFEAVAKALRGEE